jgi:transposase
MSKIYYIGLDVHKDSIAVAIAPSDSTEIRKYGVIGGTLDALDKLIKKLTQPGVELRFVYEAGPCGYVIYRHLKQRGFHCEVVAPSLIPKKASDRVKTDARDAEQLARLFRAGELTAIYVPDAEDEAVRDLVRARTGAMIGQRKARQRLKGFLLRLGFRYTGQSSWTDAHKRYLAKLIMPHPPQQIVFQEHIEAINVETERLARLTEAVENALPGWKWNTVVHALMTMRGVDVLTGMILVAEAGDMSRFDNPRQLMSFFGLTSCEHTSGEKRRQSGITKCGNGACRRILSEAAWQYRLPPKNQRALASPAAKPKQRDSRHLLESPATAPSPLQSAECRPQEKRRRRHRDRA